MPKKFILVLLVVIMFLCGGIMVDTLVNMTLDSFGSDIVPLALSTAGFVGTLTLIIYVYKNL